MTNVRPEAEQQGDRTQRLLDKADRYSKGAERAFAAGDMVAGIALITTAAQFVQIARLMEPTDG